MKTFYASRNPSSGYSGFTNFMGPADVDAALHEVFAQHPKAVVVDGSDDWYQPEERRPQRFDRLYNVNIIAYFHSGISGITYSGIVIDENELSKIPVHVQAELDIYKNPATLIGP